MKVKKVKKKKTKEEENVNDYSDIFNSFYDIFVGYQIDSKNFDLIYILRETRNIYASFVNLMDSNAVAMKQKYKFDKAPLELTYKDFGIFPNHFLLSLAQKDGIVDKVDKENKQMMIEHAVKQHQEL